MTCAVNNGVSWEAHCKLIEAKARAEEQNKWLRLMLAQKDILMRTLVQAQHDKQLVGF